MDAKLTNEKSVKDLPPIDRHGRPTTYLSYMILKLMFSRPRRWFTSEDLAKLLAAKDSDTELICHQLKLLDLLAENLSQSGKYRYNLNTRNIEAQIAIEKFLLDVELDNLPVHLMLAYSPSFPYRPSE